MTGPSPSVAIRAPCPSELVALGALCLRSKAVWGYDEAFMEACREELTFRPGELTQTQVGVAIRAGAIVGVGQVALLDDDPSAADVLRLFVEPAAIGTGVGRALFDWIVHGARRLGARRLHIEADPGAAPFYRRMGAVDNGTVPSGSIPGRVLPCLRFDLGPG